MRKILSILVVLLAFTANAVRADDAAEAKTLDTYANSATPDDSGRLGVIEENDKFGFDNQDRHYTQGLRVTWLTGAIHSDEWSNDPFVWMSDNLPVIFEHGADKRKIEWTPVGQSIFTPINLHAARPLPTDRPYGAWLYTGGGLLQETTHDTHNTLENFEVLLGVVGPEALGSLTQDDFHQFIGVAPARGWQNQLHTEPGGVVTYERKWRFEELLFGNVAGDVIPEEGTTVGNIFTYQEFGGQLRFGQNLGADYGADHVRPSLSGTGWFDPTKMTSPLGWYLFAGTQGRYVLRNIFLDGNTISDSPSVHKEPFVADFLVGASMFWANDVRLDFTLIERTKEFYSQVGTPDRFGSVGFTFGF